MTNDTIIANNMLGGNIKNFGVYAMDDACKAEKKLIEELVSLRKKVAELKKLKEEYKRMEKRCTSQSKNIEAWLRI